MLPASGNLPNRLIPGDALELATALRPDAPHRIEQSVRSVDAVQIGTYLGAEPTARDRMCRVSGKAHGAPVAHLGQRGAGVGAVVRAGAPHNVCRGDGHGGHLLPNNNRSMVRADGSEHKHATVRSQKRAGGPRNLLTSQPTCWTSSYSCPD